MRQLYQDCAATFVDELAQMIRSLRKLRSPIFVVRPRRSLPPLECCQGTRLSQAANNCMRRCSEMIIMLFALEQLRWVPLGSWQQSAIDGLA